MNTLMDHKRNEHILRELKTAPMLTTISEYGRSLVQDVDIMQKNRFPEVLRSYNPHGSTNRGRRLKGLLIE
jgi:hypothetical protein